MLRVHPQAGNVEYRGWLVGCLWYPVLTQKPTAQKKKKNLSVVDSVADFSDEEMNRIVAIFV